MVRLSGIILSVIFLLYGCSGGESDLLPGFGTSDRRSVEKLNPMELAGWQLVGKGEVKVDEEQNGLILTEGADSKGITLVSRKSYSRNVVVSFDVEPKSYEGINFVFLSASDKVTQGELKVPDDHEGNMEFWTDERVQNYIFAFHNGFYDSKPFIKKNPGLTDIARSNKLVSGKDSFSVEIGRKGRRLWIKVDGKMVVRGRDKARGGLPGGKVCFRLRGPGAGSYSCLFKNVVIRENY